MSALPKLVEVYIGLLISSTNTLWADAHQPWIMAAQVEKETCITLTHPRCWSPRAELKTSRENGIGFGQATRAYNADGSIRFDKISELRAAHAELKNWNWETRYDPALQMTGLVLANRNTYRKFAKLTPDPMEAWRFSLSAYNGGESAVMKSIISCKSKQGCDHKKWYGHVESTLVKSRVKWKGYGQSAYEINTGYVKRVERRASAYEPAWIMYGQ